jgi:hypothetical protein
MSDWSKNMAQRIADKNKQKTVSDRKSLQDKATRDDGLATEWYELGKRLGQMCKELTQEAIGVTLACDTKANNIVVTRIGTSASIKGTYSQITYAMEFSGVLVNGHNWSERFWVKLGEDGLNWFIADVDDRVFTIETIADKIISALVGA